MNLATKYRPKTWEEVTGQSSVVKILSQQLLTKNIKNTYIFSGASGCGKTTIARIFANEINQYKGVPIEIDGASNSGVDNVRNIIKNASERSLNSEYKVYIIDEAHMLTTSAWNALLKTIEEPPKYTVFIFCTTDPQKIPNTIQNRCMRFNFTRLSSTEINSRLNMVCKYENLQNYKDTCEYISRICKGEMRNALSLLDTCIDYAQDLTLENTLKALGNFTYDTYFKLVNTIIDGDIIKSIELVENIYKDGLDLKHFINTFLDFCLDLCKYSFSKDITITKLPNSVLKDLEYTCNIENSSKYFLYIVDRVLEIKSMIKNDSDVKCTIEVMVSQMCRWL